MGETSRTNFEGNPCVAAPNILPFTNWRDMATAWREQLDDAVPKPSSEAPAGEAEEGDDSSGDSEDRAFKRKDRREDTRSERRGERTKSLDHTRERDAKRST